MISRTTSVRPKKPIVLYRSKEEAESDSGYFRVNAMMISARLAKKIHTYIEQEGLLTFLRENVHKTSSNYYTLKFTLKLYYTDPEKDFSTKHGWLTAGETLGWMKPSLEHAYRMKSRNGPSILGGLRSEQEKTIAKYEELKKTTPDLTQVYFWICRKYPQEIIHMDYSTDVPSLSWFEEA